MKLRIFIFYIPLLVLTSSCQEDLVSQALDNLEQKAYENRACELIFLNENSIEFYVKRKIEEYQSNEVSADLLDETSAYSYIVRDTHRLMAENWANRKRIEDSQKACLSYQQEKNIAIGEAAKLGASQEQIRYLQLSGNTKAEQVYGAVPEQ